MAAELIAGRVAELAPGVRRLLAPNPGMMTGPGTNTYLLGQREIAIVDPGPAIPQHLAAIEEVAGAPIRWILATHTHPDHSPGARLLAEATGAEQLGWSAPPGTTQDQTFTPDRELRDGDRLESAEFTIRAVHTPGHASNHLCYLHEGLRWLFTGDHVMNGSTVVINPPDGHMAAYLASLELVKSLDPDRLAPGHGDLIHEPASVLDWLVNHRLEREAKVAATLEATGGGALEALVKKIYDDVDERLHSVAERSLLAHLIKLREDGRAREEDHHWYPTT